MTLESESDIIFGDAIQKEKDADASLSFCLRERAEPRDLKEEGVGLEHGRRRRRKKGARQGRKRGGEPAIEFAKGGECVFERAMKNPTPATNKLHRKRYRG